MRTGTLLSIGVLLLAASRPLSQGTGSTPQPPQRTEIKPELETHTFKRRIGEIRERTIPIVDVHANWNEHKQDKKIYEAEKGWIICSYSVQVPTKSNRANYGINKRVAPDFADPTLVTSMAQDLINYAREHNDEKSRIRLENFSRSYDQLFQRGCSSWSRLEFSYDVRGSGKWFDRYGAWIKANWRLKEVCVLTSAEIEILKYKVKRTIDEGGELNSLISDTGLPYTTPGASKSPDKQSPEG